MKKEQPKGKRPFKYFFDDLLYINFNGMHISVVKKSDGRRYTGEGAFGWNEARGLRKTNRQYEHKVMKEADKVVLIKK